MFHKFICTSGIVIVSQYSIPEMVSLSWLQFQVSLSTSNDGDASRRISYLLMKQDRKLISRSLADECEQYVFGFGSAISFSKIEFIVIWYCQFISVGYIESAIERFSRFLFYEYVSFF